jgi:hypothetical protein
MYDSPPNFISKSNYKKGEMYIILPQRHLLCTYMILWLFITCRLMHCEFEPRSWRGVLNTTLCDKICQWLATGRWFSPSAPVSSIKKTDRHDIAKKIAIRGVKYHKPNQIDVTLTCYTFLNSQAKTYCYYK